MGAEQNMISVIIPVYNREAYLEECVESVFAQSYQNFEIILIDAGSTDGSLSICRKLQQQDARVRVLEGTHGGVSAARNLGLDAAQGEYVFFLDSDDIIHPELLDTLLTGLISNEAVLGGIPYRNCRAETWAQDKERFMRSQPVSVCTYYNHEDTLRAVFGGKSPFGQMGGTIMSKLLIGETRFRTDLFIGEDFFFVYENLIKGVGAVFLGQNWYLARQHSTNVSWDYSFKGFWSRFKRRELVWRSEENLGRTEYANKQKLDAIGCYYKCASKHKPYSAQARKMRRAIKPYKAELLAALRGKQKIMFLLNLHCPICTQVITKMRKAAKGGSAVQKPGRSPDLPLKETDRIEEHKILLFDFLRTPLADGEQILDRFAALPGAVVGKGEKPLQRYVFVPGNRFPGGVVLVAHTGCGLGWGI